MPQAKNLDAGIGWKALAKKLEIIQDLINANDPVKGHGISIQETESGSIISVDPTQSDANQNQTGPQDGQWIAVDVMDENCNRKTIQVWAKPSQ